MEQKDTSQDKINEKALNDSKEDLETLTKLGYKSELFRGFNAFMSFSFCFSSVAVITSLCLVIGFGLQTGGPVVMTWGWIIASLFTIMIGYSMAEICSTYPVAGSVYVWSGMLASKEWAPFASFICGWFNLIGNVACDSSFAFGFSQVLSALIQLFSGGQYQFSTHGQVLTAVGILVLWAIKNRMRLDQQGWFNNTSAIYQFISTVLMALVIIVVTPSVSSSSFVWTEFNNSTGFSSVSYVCIIGVLMPLYGISGYEGGATLAEETTHASISAPKGIINGIYASVVTGFIFIVGLLYAIGGNIDNVINNGLTDQATINIFDIAFTTSDGVRMIGGSTTITIILMLNIFLAGFSHMTVTTRIAFAMVRDGALPYSPSLYHVHPVTKTPDRILILILILDSLLCLLPLVSEIAFTAITQITTIGYQISYAIPILLRLIHSDQFQQGVFNLGKYSHVIGSISVSWLLITSLILFFPSSIDPIEGFTVENFNFTIVVVAGTISIALVYWNLPERFGGAKHHFKGPKHSLNEEDHEKRQQIVTTLIQ